MCYTKPRTAKNIIGIHEALSTPSDKFMKYLSCKSIFLLLSGYDLLVKMSYLMKIKRKKEKERKNEKLTDIQNKFDILVSDNEMLQSKIMVAKKTTITLQENLNSNNSKITELERSVHKLEQYSRRECVEIAGIPWDIPHVILENVINKLT